MSRAISEGVATVTGASGKVVDIAKGPRLTSYEGIRIADISVSPGLKVPADIPALIRKEFTDAAQKAGLTGGGTPALKLSAEIIHYESGGVVDEAIGPLEEVVVRTKIMDAADGKLLAEANLIGRSKATTSSGAKNLAEGLGKAMAKWLKASGLKGE